MPFFININNQNAELLLGVKEGDIIADAKVLDGLENFKSGA